MFRLYKYVAFIIILFTPIIGFTQTHNIYINEIAASYVSVLHDEFYEYPDWIELFNNDTIELNLDGFSIGISQNENQHWNFPSVVIPAKGYLHVFASGRNISRSPAIWNTVIDKGNEWKYIVPDAFISGDWYSVEYNDSTWSHGASGFGYGDNDDATQLPEGAISVYLRKEFEVEQVQNIINALLHIDYDDAFVAYLNGVEIARNNIGSIGDTVLYDELSNNNHEAMIYQNQAPEEFTIQNLDELLHEGSNLLAVEVHNASSGSSDFSAIPIFSLGYENVHFKTEISAFINLRNSWLHTNFTLDLKGEIVSLFDSEGLLADSLSYQNLKSNVSFGRSISDLDNTGLMFPTPGEKNTEVFSIQADSVKLSLKQGFYYDKQTLFLSTRDSSDHIFYTTDGSYPNQLSKQYSDSIILDSTTILRVFASNANKLPSEVITATFFINEQVNLPVISLVTDSVHFFSNESGIYVTGTNGMAGMCDKLSRNVNQDWERPINIEFYENDGSLQLNQLAGVKIFGGCSRTRYPEKSMAFFARAEYGKGSFKYQLFEDKPIHKFESFLLRSAADDQVYTMFRDALAQYTMVEYMDVDYQAYRPVVVFLNGKYWGIHNLREKINEHYLESNYNVKAENANILDKEGNVVAGDNERYQAMISFAKTNDLSKDKNYKYMKTQMDIDQFIDYQIANIYFAESDWPGNNIKFWSADSSLYTRWRWLQYDRDHTFKHTTVDAMAKAVEVNCNCDWPNPPWSTLLFRKLLENDEFKHKFIQLFAYHMGTSFNPERLIEFIDRFQASIENEIPRHITKWGGKKDEDSTEGWEEPTFNSEEEWQKNIQEMRDFSQERPVYATAHIKKYFSLSGSTQLTLIQHNNLEGYVNIFHKKLSNKEYRAMHYKGIPIEFNAQAYVGYIFSHWVVTNGVGVTEIYESEFTYTPTSETKIEVYFKKGEDIRGPVVSLNEINYNSADNFDSGDWVELYNKHSSEIDLKGWILKDSNDENIFAFPNGSLIKGAGYFVACQKVAKFDALFPMVKNRTGDLGFKLSGSGEVVRLYNNLGEFIDSVHYDDKDPWSENADGEGYTLELISTDLNNDLVENWRASYVIGGTPGWENGSEWTSNKPLVLEQNNQIKSLYVYPNPIVDWANIDLVLPISGDIKIKISDYMGREVEIISLGYLLEGTNATAVKLNHLKTGIYIFNLVVNEQSVETIKVVVL